MPALQTALLLLLALCSIVCAQDQEVVGQRPYEMVWANRTKDTVAPLVDFENLDGWTVDCSNTEAAFTRTREQQIWGRYVGKLVYRGSGRQPTVTIRPPQPIAIAKPFDCVNLWVYGNNWAWAPNSGTPQVGISLLIKGSAQEPIRVHLGRVRWKEWWLMHRKLSHEQQALVKDAASVVGIQVDNCRNTDDRVIFFDNLACYQEPLPRLKFEPRRRWGVDPFPGQTTGIHTLPQRLPFPTREETILPDNLTKDFKTQLAQDRDAFVFRYSGSDGALEYRYEPRTGALGDVTARWQGRGNAFQPMADGGVLFAVEDNAAPKPPDKVELLGCKRVGDTVEAAWRLTLGEHTAEVTYTLRLWQKSLVIDVRCLGGQAGRVDFGRAVGAGNPRLVTVPYLVGEAQRPAVLVMGAPSRPLFLTGLVDYYRTNCSKLWFANRIEKEGVTYNGGMVYIPKTDGKRNDCFERLFLTVSPRFEEVLPNIPNPKSPWMHVAGERLWRAHGASNRKHNYAFWAGIARYGMTKVVITDHETGWRDGGESFTFRTRTAPKKGGDQSQAWYSAALQKLGFRYGIYNNYTDFAPVNEFWSPDMVNRLPDGDWQTAWARCYAPKPTRSVQYEAMLTPIIQKKFHLSTAYCDVHTAVTPWGREDYDARVPGAGTMVQQFYCFGEIMLHQKQVWNGPVYSEGNNHYYYSGLTDGNYAQDQRAKLPTSPWLVDFDLRKMHPLNCNFGMGAPGMFYGRKVGMGSSRAARTQRLDRFLAATLAFGHTGFLVRAGGTRNTCRSYFMLQQVHKHYAQETAESIRYGDGQGGLLDVSAAVATGAFERSQVATRYSNGMIVVVNGHPTETWHYVGGGIDVVLSPNGYLAQLAQDGQTKVYACSTVGKRGWRTDYADTPAYVYADARGQFARFAKAACDEAVISHRLADGKREVIPVGGAKDFGVDVDGQMATATALDKGRKDLGPARTRTSRGLVYVTPKAGAFSYILTPAGKPTVALACDRYEVVPGETVVVLGKERHTLRIPPDAQAGSRIWRQFEDAWIDFVVRPMVDMHVTVANPMVGEPSLRVEVQSNLSAPTDATVGMVGQKRTVRLTPGETTAVSFGLERPAVEVVRRAPVVVSAGDRVFEQPWWIKAEKTSCVIARLSAGFESGLCMRGGKEGPISRETGAQAHPRQSMVCGGQSRDGVFMHPPYKQGVGYSYALSKPIALPAIPAAVRVWAGKGDGSDPGDGILFRIAVVDAKGDETLLAEKQWIKHAWTRLEADLSKWAGQTVRIKLVTDVGPADNSCGDWACWGEPVVEYLEPVIGLTVHDKEVALKNMPGPYPVAGLRVQDLRAAKHGWLHYQEVGLSGPTSSYHNVAEVCGVKIGRMANSKGSSETRGIWGTDATMALPAEVVAKLGPSNKVVIHNMDSDCFKVRRFWIELELADGRKASSKVATTTYTQPGNWAYAEGVGVDTNANITTDVLFDVTE